ncbi:molybdate ABC transporter substrate-binding protein [Roseivivax sp. GX 12232]|uniref:molybdate ABC transporter substrate-binding protein n=1 Tax=Roseivivax sp. GX 12232 TaxID=2900547 RepID=UPI001E47C657|nr:molybdate ABC transporter substrate-binding protein [Roseivivax sp. GX 12232]MCE0505156.1 molybdate ABC transporter substrate-binding protein [Roseivivax sp. GX 12232]
MGAGPLPEPDPPMRLLPLLLLMILGAGLPARGAELTVFAAASTREVLEAAAARYAETRDVTIRVAPAGSATLARQIARGAPADLFVSANPGWMDWLEGEGALAGAPQVLFGNRLVLIGHGAGPDEALGDAAEAPGGQGGDTASDPSATQSADLPEVTRTTPILERLGPEGRLAVALTDAVPAGLYARAALESLGLWEGLAPRLAETDSVRAALALVALGEAPLGVVYATDARAEPRVQALAVFPETSHPPIRYPAAVTRSARAPEAAAAFLDWLAGPEAQAIYRRHGFPPVPD